MKLFIIFAALLVIWITLDLLRDMYTVAHFLFYLYTGFLMMTAALKIEDGLDG